MQPDAKLLLFNGIDKNIRKNLWKEVPAHSERWKLAPLKTD